MKRLILIALTIVSVALLACTRDKSSDTGSLVEGQLIPLDRFAPYGGGGGISPFFIAGDDLGVYMKRYNKNLEKNSIIKGNVNKRYVYDDNTTSETFGLFIPANLAETVYYPIQNMVDFVAYIPHTTSRISENTSGEYIYDINVSNQLDMVALDLLYSDNVKGAYVSGISVEPTKVEEMKFSHVLSRIDVIIKDVSSEFTATEIAAMTISVTGVHKNAKLNLKNAQISDRLNEGSIALNVGTAGEKYAGIMIPTVSDKTGREIVASIGSKTLRGPIPDSIFTDGAGWKYVFNASVGKSELDVSGVSVTPWGKGTDGGSGRAITPAFTDPNFKAFVINEYCPAGATEIFAGDLAGIVSIKSDSPESIDMIMLITSYAGLEFFTNLETLSLTGKAGVAAPDITRFNLVQNKKLKTLTVTSLGLKELDLSGNPELTVVDCSKNRVTKLDVSQNLKLETLNCSSNMISSLDLSKHSDITKISALTFKENPGNGNSTGSINPAELKVKLPMGTELSSLPTSFPKAIASDNSYKWKYLFKDAAGGAIGVEFDVTTEYTN